jgi:hypothetical protein
MCVVVRAEEVGSWPDIEMNLVDGVPTFDEM